MYEPKQLRPRHVNILDAVMHMIFVNKTQRDMTFRLYFCIENIVLFCRFAPIEVYKNSVQSDICNIFF